MRRIHAVASVIGALIAAAFGWSWLSLAAEGMPGWRITIEVVGAAVLAAFLVAGGIVTSRVSRAVPRRRGERLRPTRMVWFAVVIPVEVALIAAGRNLLEGGFGRPELIPVWTLFVVGAHFAPFAMILRIRAFYRLAGALCAVAVVSALAATLSDVQSLWWTLPGVGGAVVLWGGAGWALARIARGRELAPGAD